MSRNLVVLCLALLSSACATLSESECRSGDWRQIGYVDGLNGRPTSRLAEHGKACSEYGVVADGTAWQLGYVEGQAQYCTAASGYAQGRGGNSYGDVCPPESDREFRPAYTDGRGVWTLRRHLDELDSRLGEIGAQLAEDDRRSDEYLSSVRDGHTPPQKPELLSTSERDSLQREFERLDRDYVATLDEVRRTDAELSARYAVEPIRFVARER